MTKARRCIALGLPLAWLLVAPAGADAHGLVGRTDLPMPQWMFAWAAGFVLVLSFLALATLWPRPRLQHRRLRRLFRYPAWLEMPCALAGLAVFAVVVYSGLAGSQVPLANLAPTFVYVLFWVGIPILSVLFGDVFRPFNPWRAVGRAAGWGLARIRGSAEPVLAYPERLGRWPAAAGLVAFAWVELAYANRDDPRLLACMAIAYLVVHGSGVALFGDGRWTDRADAFGVYFRLVSRLSPVEVHDRVVSLRAPLAGVTDLERLPGTVATVCAIIGTTTFDGASNGEVWASLAPKLQNAFQALGVGPDAALELAGTVGLAISIALVTGFYLLGISGMRGVDPTKQSRPLAEGFAHTLAPIAFAYVVAHYFSLLVYQGQAAGYLVSDPLGDGANLFGTGSWQVNYTLLSAAAIWYVQVVALLAGHIGGLVLAHDRALVVYRRGEQAVRSQYWMLCVMVGFTCLGLWLLSAVST